MYKPVNKLTAASLMGLLLVSVPAAWADMKYDQVTTSEYAVGQEKKITETINQKVYVQDKRVRIDDQETGQSLLIEFDREFVYHMDAKKSTFTESSFRSLKILEGQQAIQSEQAAPQRAVGMGAARNQLVKMTEGLPPERRAFMEQQMQRQQTTLQAPGAAEKTKEAVYIKETAEAKTINGLKCKQYKVFEDKKKVMDLWVTKDAGPANYFTQIIETLGLFRPEVLKVVKQVEGFPVEMAYRIQVGPLQGVIQKVSVGKIEKGALGEALFELPKGYKKEAAVVTSSTNAEEEMEDF